MKQEIDRSGLRAYNQRMEQNPRVFVFEKKEIFLIFVFVLIMSVTCFTLGVNLGKKLALEKSGVTPADVKALEMKSVEEEFADQVMAEDKLSDEEKIELLKKEMKDKLDNELQSISQEDTPAAAVSTPATPANPNIGKFSVQLGSFNNMQDAKQFAEGFTARGYEAIIYETQLADKGTWFRVIIGIFDSAGDARDYIKKEASLFQEQDHVVIEIK
ncbi:MAG: SPOR domain-containing protein [Proteobacteria bacterium]|nr:SPOR domain-containing protein [Pseudomonadota bacterium]